MGYFEGISPKVAKFKNTVGTTHVLMKIALEFYITFQKNLIYNLKTSVKESVFFYKSQI